MTVTLTEKGEVWHDDVADVKELDDGVDRHLAVHERPELSGLDEVELAALDKRTTRKIDILMMPGLILLFLLNYIDRSNIAVAKVAGVDKTLGLTTTQYNTCVSVMYAGYVAFQVPSNMVASRVKYPGLYICTMCAIWGIVAGCHGAVQSYGGLAACRAVLGIVEAAFYPGALYMISIFYTREQMALRGAILWAGSQLGNAFSGLIAVPIITLNGRYGLEGWRWLFIVEGVLTVGCALVVMSYVPNRPETCRWLTPTERARLLYRLEANRGTQDGTSEVGNWVALKLALTDPKAWMLVLINQFNFIAASVTLFFPVVTATLGFSRTVTLVITAPPYLLAVVVMTFNGWHSDKHRERSFHIIVPFLFTIAANTIAIATLNTGARYFAMCLMPASFYSASTIGYSWIGINITGPAIKRSIIFALVNAFGSTTSIWTPYLYFAPPRYTAAFGVMLAASVCLILTTLCFRQYLKRQNAKLDRGEDTGIHGPSLVQIEAGFRYQL
ncbi:nicotinamide mononucleotide permease [Trichosporon asahii var. asahii CBS 8904]|uniref:Nicotinamide mononucleotide permease n=1 Tax=Trichosporon asahii var. asahii (strain CBS 8904) TaxID=1220162 RepID=K1V7J6_TRIAC|nr:nicotinamide mononucleotide permease [Trichosporon asahii var. asahii CBS 8904]